MSLSACRYEAQLPASDTHLSLRIIELALERRRFGYSRIWQLLHREGLHVNHKRVYRLYHLSDLVVKRRRRRKGLATERLPMLRPTAPNLTWSMDLVMDALVTGRRIECLTCVEQYSIDEMFLELTGIDGCKDFEHFSRRLRTHVLATAGLKVGVGMGPTKTLAKSAQWASKEWPQFRGVLALTPGNIRRTETRLSKQPVEEVWGVGRRIGRRIGKRLNLMGISNALQLAHAHPALIRKNFSVVLERTVHELNGESSIPLEELQPAKQQICCSRSFGERITSKILMQQALCQYATRAAEKLRGERQFCRRISIFIRTSPQAENEIFYGNSAGEKLSLPTQDRRDIIEAAMRSLDRI